VECENVLWTNTNISEEHSTSIFRVEVCLFRNRLGYVGKSQLGLACDAESGYGKELEPSQWEEMGKI
jgi:hypothetical protein